MNRKRAMQERKCFGYEGLGHIAHNCRNIESRREERSIQMFSNKFEVLTSRVINIGVVSSGGKVRKDRKTILKGEILKKRKKKKRKEKKEKPLEVRKVEGGEVLREVTVRIGLKKIDTQKKTIVKALLDNRTTCLVMSSKFT